ncbi:MAG: DNA repair protein RecO [Bacteroidota bacterium]|nr:DNA repair protein RecO [Bacteroidota bacterium]
MLHKIKGILLKRIKYGDNSKIVSVFTGEFGKQSYIVFSGKSKKKRIAERYLQPLFILDMEVYIKPNRSLNTVKELSPEVNLLSLSADIRKNAVSQLVAELIDKTVKEEEPDSLLYDFLVSAIQLLDNAEAKISNYTPAFLAKYSRFLGLMPENNYSDTHKVFDYESGKFIIGRPTHKNFLAGEAAQKFHQFISIALSDFADTDITKSERSSINQAFIDYFNYHLGKPGKLKTLEIYTEIFAS